MKGFFNKLKLIFQDRILRKKIFFTLFVLIIFRLLAAIPIPGIDHDRLAQFFSSNEFLGLLSVFSGGGLSQFSIVMLGVGPYITGSIIMQLMTIMSPKLKALYHEEGEAGRRKFTQYGRLLTVPLGFLQAFSFIKILENQQIITDISSLTLVTTLLVITAGSVLLMWIGELISEYGVGNGVSLIIFAGIVAVLPTSLLQLIASFDPSQIPIYLAFLGVAAIVIIGVVVITEAEKRGLYSGSSPRQVNFGSYFKNLNPADFGGSFVFGFYRRFTSYHARSDWNHGGFYRRYGSSNRGVSRHRSY